MSGPAQYLESLSTAELNGELYLAAARIASLQLYRPFPDRCVCRECGADHYLALGMVHQPTCTVGAIAQLLVLLAARTGTTDHSFPGSASPNRKEQGRRDANAKRLSRRDGRLALPPVSWGWYGEPWRVNDEGNVVRADGATVVDAYGSELIEGTGAQDEQPTMARIVACVNHCVLVNTEELQASVTQPNRGAAGSGKGKDEGSASGEEEGGEGSREEGGTAMSTLSSPLQPRYRTSAYSDMVACRNALAMALPLLQETRDTIVEYTALDGDLAKLRQVVVVEYDNAIAEAQRALLGDATEAGQ